MAFFYFGYVFGLSLDIAVTVGIAVYFRMAVGYPGSQFVIGLTADTGQPRFIVGLGITNAAIPECGCVRT